MAAEIGALVANLEAQTAEFREDMGKAVRAVNSGSARMNKSLAAVDARFRSLSRTTRQLAGGLGIYFSGRGALNFATNVAESADAVALLEARSRQLTGSADSFRLLFNVAQETGTALKTTADTFARFALAGKDIGLTAEQTAQLTETVQKLGRIGGASAQELANSSLQLAQGLASGRLQGDELRSVLENLPLLGRLIAERLGTSVGALRDLGAEGKLTGDVVADAILSNVESVDETFARLPVTLEQARTRIANEWTLTLAALDKSLETSGIYAFFTTQLQEFLQEYRSFLGDFSTLETTLLQAQATQIRSRYSADELRAVAGQSGKRFFPFGKPQIFADYERLLNIESELQNRLADRLDKARIEGGAGGGVGKSIANEIAQQTSAISTEAAAAAFKGGTAAIREEGARMVHAYAVETQAAQLQSQYSTEAAGNAFANANDAAEELIESTKTADEELSQFAIQGARNIQNELADAFLQVDEGLGGMVDAFGQAFRQIIAQAAAANLAQALGLAGLFQGGLNFLGLGGVKGYAMGGSPPPGIPAVVGEQGPELFIPRSAGQIIPSIAGGNFVQIEQNIDARGNPNAAELLAIMPRFADAIVRDIKDQLRRGTL